jgi:hypothetical protein
LVSVRKSAERRSAGDAKPGGPALSQKAVGARPPFLPKRYWLTVGRLEVALTQFEAWSLLLRCDDRASAAPMPLCQASARVVPGVAGSGPRSISGQERSGAVHANDALPPDAWPRFRCSSFHSATEDRDISATLAEYECGYDKIRGDGVRDAGNQRPIAWHSIRAHLSVVPTLSGRSTSRDCEQQVQA